VPSRPGEVVADRFELIRLAGQGGFGEVWRARDRAGGGEAAVKILHPRPDADDRFLREARLLSELRHPGIVRHLAHGRTPDDRLWLAMEWLEGETLADRLGRAGLTLGESVAFATRLADALAALHVRGVVHRDVKPENVFLVDGELQRAKLLDLGVARLKESSRGATRTGALLGTPGYMAPEQARGAREVDPRADVFSLGCILYECLTGQPAFTGEGVLAMLAKILLDDVPRVREVRADVPPALDDLIAAMTDKDPEARPADAAAVAFALRDLGEVEAASTASAARAAPLAMTSGEQRLLSVVLAGTGGSVDDSSDARTMPSPETFGLTLDALRAVVEAHGARVEALADGSIAVVILARAATDQAEQAARCALAMRRLLPDAPMALVTGRGVVTGRLPVGEAIDRAARLLREPPREGRPAILLDEATAGLLDARFDVGGGGAAGGGGTLELLGERLEAEVARTVLGRATPCVGRDRELSILEATWDECVAEPVARAVLVVGAEGIGKSRLRREIVARVRERGGAVLLGAGDPMRAGSPFGVLAPALRRTAGIVEGQPMALRRQRLRARVARHVAEADVDRVAAFLGELTGVPLADEDFPQLRAARADAVLLGDQMRRAFEDFLAAELGAGPVLLALDDLHWGDLPTIKFVDAALRTLGDRPLLVLATARPDVHQLFPRLWVERGLQEIRLGDLSKKASARLIREILGDASDATVEQLVAQGGGNAFYLEELARAVAAGESALPETVLAMVQARLEQLPAESRRLLRAASVYGRVFTRGAVAALYGAMLPTGAFEEQLADLCDREVIVPRGPDEYAFRHALWREAAYGSLTERDRAVGHRLAAEHLERRGETDGHAIAEHLERGGERARAAAAWRRAAEQALDANDFAEAIARAQRAASLGLDGEALGAARLVQAEAHMWRGEHADGAGAAETAAALLPAGGLAWFRAMTELLGALGRQGRYDDLAVRAEALHALPWDESAPGPQILAAATAALHLCFGGRVAHADRHLADIARADRAAAGPRVTARIAATRAVREGLGGHAEAHLALVAQAAAAFEAVGDLRNACGQRVNVGYACLELGAWDDAVGALRDALAAGERLGAESVTAAARQNLGMALAYRGELDEGRRVEEEALAMFTRHGDRRMAAGSRAYLARMLLIAGDLERAAAEADASEAGSVDVPPIRVVALATRAQIRRAQGRAGEALESARAALDLLERVGGIEGGEALVRLAHAEALHAAGRADEARAAIDAARDQLVGRASRIVDEARRRQFLRVPEHARTLLLAEQWTGRTA
jgi:eukaryotic-like serine/threonine-protein kinase